MATDNFRTMPKGKRGNSFNFKNFTYFVIDFFRAKSDRYPHQKHLRSASIRTLTPINFSAQCCAVINDYKR